MLFSPSGIINFQNFCCLECLILFWKWVIVVLFETWNWKGTSCGRKMSFSTACKYACFEFQLKNTSVPTTHSNRNSVSEALSAYRIKKEIILLFSADLILWQKKFWGLTDRFVFDAYCSALSNSYIIASWS